MSLCPAWGFEDGLEVSLARKGLSFGGKAEENVVCLLCQLMWDVDRHAHNIC